MIIRAIRVRLQTDRQIDFGFQFAFSRNLTIVRGGNSTGKSTFFNSLLYGLGMEELIGGRGERALPYALKHHFEYDTETIGVTSSEVLVEIENASNQIVTLRRAIRDDARSSRLIEIFHSEHLTNKEPLGTPTPTYLHDPGSAQRAEGFYFFLERFLDLQLPRVATTSGGEAKLYLQAIFSALAVEQKRGWTDYVANIPFYGIRDARTRVVEYLLNLSVFESTALRNRLNSDLARIEERWTLLVTEFKREAADAGIAVEGLPTRADSTFQSADMLLVNRTNSEGGTLGNYIAALRLEYAALQGRAESYSKLSGGAAIAEIDKALADLQRLSGLHDQTSAQLSLQRASLREYEELLKEAKEDLDRNKVAAKLRALGAQHSLKTAEDRCPTCNQPISDSLLVDAIAGPQMNLEENIAYLESQCRMLERQIAGYHEATREAEGAVAQLATQVAAKHDELSALRGDVSEGATESRAIIKRQVQIDALVPKLERLEEKARALAQDLAELAVMLEKNHAARGSLPKSYYSSEDEKRIALFEKLFRANAGSFGYESAQIADIEMNRETLVPFLHQLELRQIAPGPGKADIKADSSASDFVRLIWSYLLGLYQTSSHRTVSGNHPGILLLDEPGQHSMAEDSQHALLRQLSGESRLQSIVAASFDESESVFLRATESVAFRLLQWDGRIIQPLRGDLVHLGK